MVNLADHATHSEALGALSLVLNVLQAVALAWIATRSNRVRREDAEKRSEDVSD